VLGGFFGGVEVASADTAAAGSARRTTSVKDSPGFLAARSFSYASSSSVMVLVLMHEKYTK
jgi:hypothetical protein